MYVWSLALIVVLVGCSPIDSETKCARGKAADEVYTLCGASPDCYITRPEKDRWINAKADMIRWCPNEGRR